MTEAKQVRDSSGTILLDLVDEEDANAHTVKGIAIYGRRVQGNVTKNIPVAANSDPLVSLASLGIPVFNITTEKLEGTKITDGTNQAVCDTDDGNVATGQTTLLVICLNYVSDGNGNWVPMTQPS